jgi:hypothetical protein
LLCTSNGRTISAQEPGNGESPLKIKLAIRAAATKPGEER